MNHFPRSNELTSKIYLIKMQQIKGNFPSTKFDFMPNIIFKLGIHIPTDEKVTIKILEKDKIQDKEDFERISREINFLSLYFHIEQFLE